MPGRCLPQVGERHDAAVGFHQRDRETHQVVRIEAAQREALLVAGLVVQPLLRNRRQCRQQCRHLCRCGHAETQAAALAAVPGLAQVGAFASFQAEILQRHHRLFAQFDQGQPQVEVGLPVGFANLIEHRAQAEPVGFLTEAPDQPTRHVRRADRVAHGDERTAVALHHHKAPLVGITQHRLVGSQHQAGLGVFGGQQDGRQRVQRGHVGRRQRAAGAVQQPRQAEDGQGDGHHQQRTQRARRIALQGELPPQLVLVLHVAVDEEQQPDHRHQHQPKIADPRP